jgi:hypothetical protein
MANLCSTMDAHMKEITERVEANPDEPPETAPPAEQPTKKLFAKLAAHDMLFSMLGDSIERF